QNLRERGMLLGNRCLPQSHFLSADHEAELTAIENVITVGYPDGRWDQVNNRPIVRRGITATPLSIDYEGRREFLIDAACFPGTSGSPVFLLEEGLFNFAPDQPLHQTRFRLAGVLSEEPAGRIERA